MANVGVQQPPKAVCWNEGLGRNRELLADFHFNLGHGRWLNVDYLGDGLDWRFRGGNVNLMLAGRNV